MANIKTKDVIKGTIKTLDRAAIATDRVKHAYVASTKTTIENVKKSTEFTKEKVSKAKQGMENFKTKRAEEFLKKQAGRGTNKATNKATNQTIRTAKEVEKSVKQSVTSAGNKTIKRGLKAPAKTSRRYLKTAEKTSKTAIKTTEHTTKVAKNTARTSAKVAQRAAQATKKAAQATAKGVKVAVKATIQTVKAIIASTKALITAIIAGGWVAVVVIVICVLLGAAISLFGGGTENSGYTPVSQEVEAYTPTITKYAKQYGIPEYVELIKAVMMQESGGRGNDPRKAADEGMTQCKRQRVVLIPDTHIRLMVFKTQTIPFSVAFKN